MHRGKTAVITGASRGIGLEIVKTFAREHACIYACSRSASPEYLSLLAELSARYQVTIQSVCFDLSDCEAVQAAIKQIIRESEYIDILVNNAGISYVKLFGMTRMDDLRRVFDVNYFAQLQIIQMILKKMMKQRSGSIINICSASGLENQPGGLVYGSSKAAFLYATKTLAVEYGKYGIRVNAVSPGFIQTDMWKDRDEKTQSEILSEIPLARQGMPADVAEAVSFLASEKASFITGRNIIIDGGRV